VRRVGSDRRPAPVSLTPDGSVVALGPSVSSTFRMVEIATGRARLALPGSAAMAREVALSPRGDAVALTYFDGSARLWVAPGESPRMRLSPEKGFGFESLALSPDGARLAAVLVPLRSAARGVKPAPPGTAPRVRLIDVRTGQDVARWEQDGAFACAFTSDGRRVLTLSTKPPLTQRSALTGEPDGPALDAAGMQHRPPAFDPPGARVVILASGGPRLFDLATGRELARLGKTGADHAAFSPDGTRVVTSDRAPVARVWDAATGRERARLEGHQGAVRCAAFSPDGRHVVTGSEDATARIVDADTGREEATLRGHRLDVHAVAFTPDGKQVITASSDGTARLWPVDARAAALASRPRELTPEERARFEVGLGR
jgi:WD40 repeat protein